MKKYSSIIVLVILLTCLSGGNLLAQRLYVNVNTGYAVGINKSNISNFTETATSYSYNRVGLSFGKGVTIGATVGYMFTNNMGFDLGISYLSGGKTTSTNTYTGTDRKDIETYSGNMFRINPSFVVSASSEKVNPYVKMGLIVGAGSFTHSTNEMYTNKNVYITDYKWNGGLAVGFTSALGATYKLNNNLSLFGELSLISLSYAPEKMKVTKATDNGTDVLPSMSVYNKETDFVTNYTVDKTVAKDYTKPNKTIKVGYPFSSIGINFGIRFNLEKYIDEVQKSAN